MIFGEFIGFPDPEESTSNASYFLGLQKILLEFWVHKVVGTNGTNGTMAGRGRKRPPKYQYLQATIKKYFQKHIPNFWNSIINPYTFWRSKWQGKILKIDEPIKIPFISKQVIKPDTILGPNELFENFLNCEIFNHRVSYQKLNVFSLELLSSAVFSIVLFENLKIDGEFFDKFLENFSDDRDKESSQLTNDDKQTNLNYCYKALIFLKINSKFNFSNSNLRIRPSNKDYYRDKQLLDITKILILLLKKLESFLAKSQAKNLTWTSYQNEGYCTKNYHIKQFIEILIEILCNFSEIAMVRDYVFQEFPDWEEIRVQAYDMISLSGMF